MAEWKRLLAYDELTNILPQIGNEAYRTMTFNATMRIPAGDRNEIIFPRPQSWYSDSTPLVHKYGSSGAVTTVNDINPITAAECTFFVNPYLSITVWYGSVMITSNKARDSESGGYDWCLYDGDPITTWDDAFGGAHYDSGANLSVDSNNSGSANWPTISHGNGQGMIGKRWFAGVFFKNYPQNVPFLFAIK